MSFLSAKSLTKVYKNKVAVNHIDLTINQGEFVTILGPNGAGKSTTIEMLTGLLKPTSGTIQLEGIIPAKKAYRDKIGIVFQNSVLDRELSVQDNLMLRANMYQNKKDVFEIAKTIGIEKFMKQKYGTLSGGQRRRVDIARALLHRPEVLFLDEPTTGLDVQTRTTIWKVIEQLRKEWNVTIVLTTQYLEEAETSDKIYIVDSGKVLIEDSVQNIRKHYAKNTLVLHKEAGQQAVINNIDKNEAIKLLNENESIIDNFEYHQSTMDDIFMELTGKDIR
ncbi:ABC transporter ATP-binding protein [Fructilactobacillus sp. Tb1]|uniref:ABC transporter ATP-binding protein n=1 Tax=Fructilactobacillus sp. Tb1 TaxID=3422304 RepID=UPI003D26994C